MSQCAPASSQYPDTENHASSRYRNRAQKAVFIPAPFRRCINSPELNANAQSLSAMEARRLDQEIREAGQDRTKPVDSRVTRKEVRGSRSGSNRTKLASERRLNRGFQNSGRHRTYGGLRASVWLFGFKFSFCLFYLVIRVFSSSSVLLVFIIPMRFFSCCFVSWADLAGSIPFVVHHLFSICRNHCFWGRTTLAGYRFFRPSDLKYMTNKLMTSIFN